MRQTAIQFYSKGMAVEGVLSMPERGTSDPGIVVACHPHPVLGGDMDNRVVVAVCQAVDGFGLASLRFNFRGVKGSEGRFSNGPGERDDLVAAVGAMRRWPGVNGGRMAVAGYSFGAGVALGAMGRLKTVKAFAVIAPPVSSVRSLAGSKMKRSTMFVAGSQDRIAPSLELQRELDGVTGPVSYAEVPGADHSLTGREDEAAALVANYLADTLA